MINNFFKKVAFYVQRRSHNVQLRNIECNLFKLALPKGKYNTGINTLNIIKEESSIYNDLSKDGFSDLGITISSGQIDSVVNELKNLNCYNTGTQQRPIVDLNNVDDNVQLAHYKRADLASISQIIEIANDSKILNVVTKYFGVQPTISNINCWWSFGNRTSAKDAQYYHRDLDDYKFLKMFIYLTDVNEDCGPHIYVKGSHKSNKLKELRRFSDEEVNKLYDSDNIITLTKSQGNTFIEDTYGIHKGQLPVVGNRLILQIQYSYFPLHVEKYEPGKSVFSENMKYDEYINRLLFTK
jgi:hypothetical protein